MSADMRFKVAVVPLNEAPPESSHFSDVEEWERAGIHHRWPGAQVEVRCLPTVASPGDAMQASESQDLIMDTLTSLELQEACTFRGFCVHHKGYWALIARTLDPRLGDAEDYESWGTAIENGKIESCAVAPNEELHQLAMRLFGEAQWLGDGGLGFTTTSFDDW